MSAFGLDKMPPAKGYYDLMEEGYLFISSNRCFASAEPSSPSTSKAAKELRNSAASRILLSWCKERAASSISIVFKQGIQLLVWHIHCFHIVNEEKIEFSGDVNFGRETKFSQPFNCQGFGGSGLNSTFDPVSALFGETGRATVAA